MLAAFGKHPGWDDHIEDIGLRTDVLVAVKSCLYVRGIGENVDSGRFAQLEAEGSAIAFKHVFIWCRGDDIVAGNVWSSRDGTGRTSYPMVVCAHCRHLPAQWVYNSVLPLLDEIERKCKSTSSACEVQAVLSDGQQYLDEISAVVPPGRDRQGSLSERLVRLAKDPEMGPDGRGVLRILYHLHREASIDALDMTGKIAPGQSTLVRIPCSQDHALDGSRPWLEFLLARFGEGATILALMPRAEEWFDVIVGEPIPAQLYCLRASLAACPSTTTIPYSIGEEFVEQFEQLIRESGVSGVGPRGEAGTDGQVK